MSKFKVGDKIRVVRNTSTIRSKDELIGNIYTIKNEQKSLTDPRKKYGIGQVWVVFEDEIEPATDRYELHITCNDGKTTNAIYKVNGEIKERKQAICAPSDEFDFATGAQTALERVFPQPAQEEPAQPKAEPIKLYCVKNKTDVGVKDYSKYLTVGKIYEFDGHRVEYDTLTSAIFEDFDHWKKGDHGFASCLIPLVSRPAKVGEWVYMVRGEPIRGDWKKGEIYQVAELYSYVGVRISKPSAVYVNHDEYLVLDGYAPEPEYYNGKVVCVDNGFIATLTVGKVYEVKDGFFYNDAGRKNPLLTGAIKTLEDMNARHSAKFIEFKGE